VINSKIDILGAKYKHLKTKGGKAMTVRGRDDQVKEEESANLAYFATGGGKARFRGHLWSSTRRDGASFQKTTEKKGSSLRKPEPRITERN